MFPKCVVLGVGRLNAGRMPPVTAYEVVRYMFPYSRSTPGRSAAEVAEVRSGIHGRRKFPEQSRSDAVRTRLQDEVAELRSFDSERRAARPRLSKTFVRCEE